MSPFMKAWNLFQFELFVATLCLLSGIPLAIGVAPSPNSVVATMPTWTHFAWGLSLSLGGLCTVTGILWRFYRPVQFVPGLYVEKAGLNMLAASSAVLSVAIGFYAGGTGLLTSGICGALAAACVSRIRTINKEARIVDEHGGREA